MDPALAGQEVAEWVLGLEADIDKFNSLVESLSPEDNVVWRLTLAFQFSLAVVTAGSYRNCNGATDDAQTRLLEAVLEIILPALVSSAPAPRKGLLGSLRKKPTLSEQGVFNEFRALDGEIRSALVDGLKTYESDGKLPSVPLWTMRSHDPLICGLGRAVDLTLCRRIGFLKGSQLSAYAHLLLVTVCRDALKQCSSH